MEAIKVSTSNGVRQLEDIVVIQDYDNTEESWKGIFVRSTAMGLNLHPQYGLPIVSLTVDHHDESIVLHNVKVNFGNMTIKLVK